MKNNLSQCLRLWAAFSAAVLISGCASIDMPKGRSKGHSSARFMKPDRLYPSPFIENSLDINDAIRAAIQAELEGGGLAVVEDGADLIVGFLFMVKDEASTTVVDDYFGYNRESDKMADIAHKKGKVTPGAYGAGAVVIDVLDAKTNKLIYRNFAKRDLSKSATAEVRQQRINSAVNEALAPFFR